MKRILTIICATAFAFCLLFPAKVEQVATAQTATPIDIYIIAGQSNALGSSTSTDETVLDSETNGVFHNVWYAHDGDRVLGTPEPDQLSDVEQMKKYVAWGLGWTNRYGGDCIGPEYGMAQTLHSMYDTQNPALIFKSAAGGTSMFIENTGTYGNWCPPSLWNSGYEPNGVSDQIGALYHNMIKGFKSLYTELVSENYAPVVKGMVWIQGEYNLGYHEVYKNYLVNFIKDVRSDLIEITSDKTLGAMPFIIGGMNKTFVTNPNQNAILFAEMQRQVAQEMNGVYMLSTDDYIVVNPDGTNRNYKKNGTGDNVHYCADDMIDYGNRIARAILDAYDEVIPSVIVNDEKLGRVTASVNDDTVTVNVAVEQSTSKRYVLSSLKIDGIEKANELTNGTLSFVATSGRPLIEAQFVEENNFSVTYEYDESKVSPVTAPKKIYEGETLSFKLGFKDGYEAKEVKVNGVTVLPNDDGYYTFDNVRENIRVEIAHQKKGASAGNTTSTGGCANALSTVLSALTALATIFFIIKK